MPEVRVQDEQGNVHVFPDGSTPEMIAQAMNVKPPSAQPAQAATPKPSLWSNPKEYFQQRAQEMGQSAQNEMNQAMGPESQGKSWISRAGHAAASYLPATAQVIDKAAGGLVGWEGAKNAAAIAAGAVDPAIPAAYYGAQGVQGMAQNAKPIVQGNATPENVQDELLSASAVAGAGAAGGSPNAGAAVRVPSRINARMQSPLGQMVSQPRGTVPAEAATPIELKQYADANGIPLTAAQATEHNLPRNLQSVGERATVGGTLIKQQTAASRAAVAGHAQNLMDKFSPNTPDVSTAGAVIKQNVEQALEQQKAIASANYAKVDQAAQGTRIDMQPIIDETKNILGDHGFVSAVAPQMGPKRALAITRSIQDIPNQLTFTQAQQLRSALLDEGRNPETALSSEGQGIIKHLTGMLDEQMETAARTSKNPQLLPLFRDANAHYTSIQNDFNNPRSPLAQILQEPDPSKVPQKLTQQGQIGGSPYNVGLLDKYGIDKGPVKWAITGDLLKKDFGLYNGGKTLGGYSDSFLGKVFDPAELDSIYKTGAIARSVNLKTNPSGTSVVEGAMHDVEKPVKSLLPKAAAAKATTSQSFNDRLMTPPGSPSVKQPGPLTIKGARMQSLKRLGLAGVGIGAATAREDDEE